MEPECEDVLWAKVIVKLWDEKSVIKYAADFSDVESLIEYLKSINIEPQSRDVYFYIPYPASGEPNELYHESCRALDNLNAQIIYALAYSDAIFYYEDDIEIYDNDPRYRILEGVKDLLNSGEAKAKPDYVDSFNSIFEIDIYQVDRTYEEDEQLNEEQEQQDVEMTNKQSQNQELNEEPEDYHTEDLLA